MSVAKGSDEDSSGVPFFQGLLTSSIISLILWAVIAYAFFHKEIHSWLNNS